jgi:enediyne biosynthesis protein E4
MKKNTEPSNYQPSRAVQGMVMLVFVGLLAIPPIMQMDVQAPGKKKIAEASKSYALEYFGFFLEEVSNEVGVNFVHQTPQLDPRLDHILPTIASTGASVSVCDFNNDGWNDFYLTTSKYGASNALYKNLGDGTFINIAEELGVGNINLDGMGVSMGAIWADINNDGYEDLFVYKWGKPELFLNIEGERFENISKHSKLPAWLNSNAAIWLDFNNDGYIDLLIGGYYHENVNLWNLENTLIMPESFEYANNGGRNFLLENQGDNTFKDVTFSKGLLTTKWTLAFGAADFDNNGFIDIFIANDYSVDELYMNFGDKGFQEIGKEARIGYAPKSGMNVSIADVKNDGRFGIYVSNITEMGILLQGNNMWQPVTGGDKIQFVNNAGMMGIELGGWSYGAQFGDLNNDGYQDLYLANGYISAAKNNSYWYDYSKVTGGNKTIISDALNWPAMAGRSQSGYQHNKIWMNNENGIFADVSDYVSDLEAYDSRAVAFADLSNSGTLDVIVANQNKEVSVLKNEQPGMNNWVAFKLEGTTSNRSAIGARLTLVWDGISQTQIVSGGMGFCAQNQRSLHFGIGKSVTIEKAIVTWPNGLVQTFSGLEINKLHHLREGNENS